MRVLITGYGPFFGQSSNPSLELIHKIEKMEAPCEIVTKELPVEFLKIKGELEDLDLNSFDIILFCGLAGSRTVVSVEKVAINYRYCPDRPDNSGLDFKRMEEVEVGGAVALASSLKCEQFFDHLRANEIASEISFNAGTYVCNTTLYEGLRILQGSKQCAFIHLPLNIDTSKLAKVFLSYFEKDVSIL